MADKKPATIKTTIAHKGGGAGPRSFVDASRKTHILRAGQSVDAEIYETEKKALGEAFLIGDAAESVADAADSGEVDPAIAAEAAALEENNKADDLKAIAEKEGIDLSGAKSNGDRAMLIAKARANA